MAGSEPRRLSVLVSGPAVLVARVRSGLGEHADVREAAGPPPGSGSPVDAIVLSADGDGALSDALRSLRAPALVCAPPERLPAVLAALREGDDACGPDDPPALLAFRVRRIAESTARPHDPLTGLATRTVQSTSRARVTVTVSIGAVVLDKGQGGVTGVMDRVSERLLEAKRGGRNRVCL